MPKSRTARVHPAIAASDETVITCDNEQVSEDAVVPKLDVKGITNYFLGFWNATHAKEALKQLELLEMKSHLRKLQKEYGSWRPPPELAESLKKPTKVSTFSNLPDNKDSTNLRFVLKILGCSLHENRPYKRFLKAKTHRQKRKWLYEYQGPAYNFRADYVEPICATRLKRLYHFFPDRFRQEDGYVYFNDQLLSYDETSRVFFIGFDRGDESDADV